MACMFSCCQLVTWSLQVSVLGLYLHLVVLMCMTWGPCGPMACAARQHVFFYVLSVMQGALSCFEAVTADTGQILLQFQVGCLSACHAWQATSLWATHGICAAAAAFVGLRTAYSSMPWPSFFMSCLSRLPTRLCRDFVKHHREADTCSITVWVLACPTGFQLVQNCTVGCHEFEPEGLVLECT